MVTSTLSTPAFGQADLSNCEREQIHFAGSIQPHGALLVVRESDLVIVQVSANAADFLHIGSDRLGRSIDEIPGNLAERIRPQLEEDLHLIPVAVRCSIGERPIQFDVLLHRPPDGSLVIELERAVPPLDLRKEFEGALQTILAAPTLRALCEETADIFERITGYDRVMVYRFDQDGHGEVFSERKKPELEPYLGNRYPASDIPQMARRLYQRNRIRVLVDVDYDPVPLTPRVTPITGVDLDMSLCFLRSMSPIHIQYLKNMGVAATMVASLVVGGKLWGLVACHHYSPRTVAYELRAACELLAETIATRIAALDSFDQARAALSVRRVEQRMIEAISCEGDWRSALFDSPQSLLQSLDASGTALLFEGQVQTAGEVPGTRELREIGAWLDRIPRQPVFATNSLGTDAPDFAPITSVASGLMATPLSSMPGEYLLWFRPEQVRTVTWGGNPYKPVIIGNNPLELSPRRSFAQWHQLVEGTSESWTQADLTAARVIGETVADVVLQFRSVSMLIAQDQLEKVSRQVRLSQQPVVTTDPSGRILLTNESFNQLWQPYRKQFETLDDLVPYFTRQVEARRSIKDLLKDKRPWRGEVTLQPKAGETKSLLVRADPVSASPGRLLGFVVLFTDLTDRSIADAARRRFQTDIIAQHRAVAMPLDSNADLLYRNLMASVVANAQLAALEITDSMDVDGMPVKLESVQASVGRAAQLLEHLIWHATVGTAEDS